jgi:hypothetical protein
MLTPYLDMSYLLLRQMDCRIPQLGLSSFQANTTARTMATAMTA